MAAFFHTHGSNSAADFRAITLRTADYLFRGAATKEQEIALAALNDRISWDDAIDHFVPAVEQSIQAEMDAALDALKIAFAASGEWERLKITNELATLDPLAWERFDELTSGLRLSMEAEGLHHHVALVDQIIGCSDDLADPEFIKAAAWDLFARELANARAAPPVHLSASTEMRALLGVGDLPPDLTSVRWLLANQRADNEAIPGKHYKPFGHPKAERMAFFEICFSPTKSVSIELAFSSPERRAAIRRVQEQAVEKAMHAVSDVLGRVWVRGHQGQRVPEKGELAWISFGGEHSTSRKGDPQLHSHVAVLNVVRSLESNRIGSLSLLAIRGHFREPALTFERPYQIALAEGLAALGIKCELINRRAEATGVPAALIQTFSQRRIESEQAANRRLISQGFDLERLPGEYKNARVNSMVFETRPEKAPNPPLEKWVQQAIEAVGTEAWQRMATERGWVQHHRAQEPERIREAKERARAGLPVEYHRGGSRELDWGLTR